jgi:hypothetical protein
MANQKLLQKAQSVLDNCEGDRKERARVLMKRHQRGEGKLYLFEDWGCLSWPASDGIGGGGGFWSVDLTEEDKRCECYDFTNRRKDCKHFVLLARLITYWHDKDQRVGA